MLCNEEFHSVNDTPWVVNKTFIRLTGIEVDMSCVREAQAARRLASSTRKDVVSQRSQRNVDVEQNNNEEGGDEIVFDNNDSTGTSSAPAGLKREAPDQLSIQREENVETHESDEESRFSTVDEGAAAKKRSKRTEVTAFESLSSEDEDDLDHEDTKHWLDAVSKDDINVFRVRIFKNDSLCNDDKFGRKCSFWCIQNGYVASGALMLIVDELRDKIQTGGLENVRDHIRGMDHQHLLKICRECKPYSSIESTTYAKTYRYFIEIKPGDIVAMHVSGKDRKKDGPNTALVFGVVQDDMLIHMSKDEARKDAFPWNFQKEGQNIRGFDNGIMLRKVKWHRQGVIYDVRGDEQAKWLAECQGKWMAKIGEKYLKKAIKEMSSDKFIGNTSQVTDEWIEVGLTGK